MDINETMVYLLKNNNAVVVSDVHKHLYTLTHNLDVQILTLEGKIVATLKPATFLVEEEDTDFFVKEDEVKIPNINKRYCQPDGEFENCLITSVQVNSLTGEKIYGIGFKTYSVDEFWDIWKEESELSD